MSEPSPITHQTLFSIARMGYETKDEEENEIEARTRIVHNYMQDRTNCMVLKIDTKMSTANEISPFGFHFEFDKEKYKKRKKAMRKEKIFKWLSLIAYYHHKFGIRHLLLIALLTIFIFAGAAMFYELEAPHELEAKGAKAAGISSQIGLLILSLETTIASMNTIISVTITEIDNITSTMTGVVKDQKLKRLLKNYYKQMLVAEDRFDGSAWHKAENLDMHLTWYFSSSTFYCITLFTTIGYGTISCQTTAGRIATVIYASLGIPLMLVVLGDLGECFQKLFTKIYGYFLIKYRKWRKKELPDESDLVLPVSIAIFIVLIYFVGCSLFIYLFDKEEGNLPGMEFADAFYFTFISLTTIGLGDVMPYNIQYSPTLSAAFLLGLALVSIVNTSIYARLYDTFFNMIEAMETFLDSVHLSQNTEHGHKVLQDLEPAIRLLVCSFPDVGSHRKHALDQIAKDKERLRLKRSKSCAEGAEHFKTKYDRSRMRAPTLGAIGGRPLPQRRTHAQDTPRTPTRSEPEPYFEEPIQIPVTASSSATTVTVTDETLYLDSPGHEPMFSFPTRFFEDPES